MTAAIEAELRYELSRTSRMVSTRARSGGDSDHRHPFLNLSQMMAVRQSSVTQEVRVLEVKRELTAPLGTRPQELQLVVAI
jgi:hypothetical protein